jgi:AAA family ATP:ADP antiporter
MILRDRYLLGIALLMMVLNFVNTNGEYILGKTVTAEAARQVAAGAHAGADPREWTERFVGGFYGDYFWWVNLVTALVQMFLVSRILKWFGVRVALFVLPAIAFLGYGLLALAPVLSVVRIAKIVENSTDYSLQNTARHALFLPTSREAKYKAKAAIDSFFWRGGDLLSSGLVFAGSLLALATRQIAAINLALVVAWIAIVAWIAAEHRTRTRERDGAPEPTA